MHRVLMFFQDLSVLFCCFPSKVANFLQEIPIFKSDSSIAAGSLTICVINEINIIRILYKINLSNTGPKGMCIIASQFFKQRTLSLSQPLSSRVV